MRSSIFTSRLHSSFSLWEKFYEGTSPAIVTRKETITEVYQKDTAESIYIVNTVFRDISNFGSTVRIGNNEIDSLLYMVTCINVQNQGYTVGGAISLCSKNSVAYYLCGQNCKSSMSGELLTTYCAQKCLAYGLSYSSTDPSSYNTCSFHTDIQKVSNCNFSKFKVSSTAAFDIGAGNGESFVAFCTMNENTQQYGDVMSVNGGSASLKMHYSSFVKNSIPGTYTQIIMTSNSMVVDNCIFKENTAGFLFRVLGDNAVFIATNSYINGNTVNEEINSDAKNAKIESRSETEIEFKHNYPNPDDDVCGLEAAGDVNIPAQWDYQEPPQPAPEHQPQPQPQQPDCTIVMAPIDDESNPNMTVYTIEFSDGEKPSKDKEGLCTVSYRKEPVIQPQNLPQTSFPTIDPNYCDQDCQNLKEEKIKKESAKQETKKIIGAVIGSLIAGIVLTAIVTVCIMKHRSSKNEEGTVVEDNAV